MTESTQVRPMTFPDTDGEGTDGCGTCGIVEEKNRELEDDAETMEGEDTDGLRSTAMVRQSGLASDLERGGITPGGGLGNSEGSIGTGAGSNAERNTGILKKWDKGQHEESGR